ncbi:polysaccharide lyase family 7 protein, partial [Streptomyces sp. NPDC002144]
MSTSEATAADPSKAPGGNFDLSVWQLQEPVGSPGSPTTIPSSRLQGANGYQDSYFYTDQRDGAMTFWAPEKGVTTPNSNYARSELRELTSPPAEAGRFFPRGLSFLLLRQQLPRTNGK